MVYLRAAVLQSTEDLQVITRSRPEPGAGEVLIRVSYCGICGSDLHAYTSGLFPFGMTIGHEFSGVIEGAGPGAEDLSKGEKVTGIPSLACGSCFSCLAGRDNICEAMSIVGVSREGAMAEYLVVPRESVAVIPAGMSLELGTLVEPYSVALHCAKRTNPAQNQVALVFGAGAIGTCLFLELKRRGLKEVIVVDINEDRLMKAKQMGAWATINPGVDNLSKRVGELTTGAGVDLVFECVGIPDTIKESVNLVRQGGTIMVLGICEIPVELFFLGLVTREIEILTAYGSTAEEFKQALELIAADPSTFDGLLGKKVPLENVDREGFTPLLKAGSSEIRVLVEIN